MKFTGLTGPDVATYGLAWAIQFGRLRGVLRTAVLLGKSPLLVSNSVFVKMRALTDHDNSRVWFPADGQWLQLQRGQKGHMKMELFNFETGGAIPDDSPPPRAASLNRNDLELDRVNEFAPPKIGENEHVVDSELGCASDAQRAIGLG